MNHVDPRVHIHDHGVLEQIDPDSAEPFQSYLLEFEAIDDQGNAHWLAIGSAPDEYHGPGGSALYELVLKAGTALVAEAAGLKKEES